MRVEGAYIELTAADPAGLAAFYERLAGFERLNTTPQAILLGSGNLTIAIRRGSNPPSEGGDGGPLFGFVVAPTSGSDALRDELAAAGAILLSESKREGRRTLTCSDPVGHEFTVVVSGEVLEQERTAGALVVANAPSAPPRSAPASTESVAPVGDTKPPGVGTRITRRDLDRLRDSVRLAEMQEAIAGLHGSFGSSDPAGVLDEMRAKVGGGFDHEEAREREAQLRREELAADAESMLARYKRESLVHEEEPSAEPARVQTNPRPSDDDANVDVARIRRSLGGSGDAEE
jgi:hypothetical protein